MRVGPGFGRYLWYHAVHAHKSLYCTLSLIESLIVQRTHRGQPDKTEAGTTPNCTGQKTEHAL